MEHLEDVIFIASLLCLIVAIHAVHIPHSSSANKALEVRFDIELLSMVHGSLIILGKVPILNVLFERGVHFLQKVLMQLLHCPLTVQRDAHVDMHGLD